MVGGSITRWRMPFQPQRAGFVPSEEFSLLLTMTLDNRYIPRLGVYYRSRFFFDKLV